MNKISRYRSLLIGGFVGTAVFMGGCAGGQQKKHETLKEEQYKRWNLTRVGVMYQLAEQQYAVGEYDKCKETLAQALSLKAPIPKLKVLAAKVEIEKGSLEAAAEYLRSAIAEGCTEPEPFYLMGVVYQRWQKADVACDYYQQAWDKKPDDALYMLAVVEMKITVGKLDGAQQILEDHLVYFEQSAAVRAALARIASLKNDFAKASKYYRDAVVLAPDDAGVRRAYAESLFYAGKYAEAVPVFEEMRREKDVTDKTSVLQMLGQSYLNMRRPYDSRNCYQEILRGDSNNKTAYLGLAKATIETNEYGVAMSATRKVLRMDPDNVQALLLTAVVQQKQKKWSDSMSTLDKAAKLAPADSTVLCMQGISSQELGKNGEAVAFYEKAVQVNPKDAWAGQLLDRAKPSEIPEVKKTETPVEAGPTSMTPAVPEVVPVVASNAATETPAPAAAVAPAAADASPMEADDAGDAVASADPSR